MTPIDRSPTPLASMVSVAAAVAAVLVTGLYSWFTLGLGVAGSLSLIVGVVTGRQAAVTLGAVGLFAGVLVAGVDGAPALVLLLGAVAAALAWDSATTAIGLGEQLGRQAATRRVELVRVTATTLVGGAGIAVAYSVYTFSAWNVPLTAGLLFSLAVVLIASALR